MQLQAICDARVGAALAGAIEEICEDLVCNEQSQEIVGASPRERREQCGTVDVGALSVDRGQGILTQCLVRYVRCELTPSLNLSRDGELPPT